MPETIHDYSKNNKFKFEVTHTYKKARVGRITTAHGYIDTPVFMPVGTNAAMKCMSIDSLYTTGAQILLANTYHLMLRPGADLVNKQGGLHKFMNCKLPILTDSGGFQVMSLSKLNTIKEDGVEFRSHIDGKKYFLTPQLSTQIQHMLDSDITMTLDICTKEGVSYEQAKKDVEVTTNWAAMSRESFQHRQGYAQFGIIQGNVFRDLRELSAKQITDLNFEGYAIGGVILGENQSILFPTLDYATSLLPDNKPKYLMGVGLPADIIGSVARGIDMFDCVLPARSARHAMAFTSQGTVSIKNTKNIGNTDTVDPLCDCCVCKNYTKGYLHHLFKCKETLGSMLLTYHNIWYFQKLMKKIRNYITQERDFDFIY